jgi:glycosyltransferase involved in cell wall biosynthesis
MSSPRIWIINQFANTPDLPGHTRQYELGRYLADQGYGVTVFSSDYNLNQRRYRRLRPGQLWQTEPRGQFGPLNWCWLWASPYQDNDWRRYVNLVSFCFTLVLRSLVEPRPDLILASSPQLPAAWVAMHLARWRGAQFWLEVRDLWPQVLIDLGGKSPRSPLVRGLGWLERQVYRAARQVVVLAAGSAPYVEQRGARAVAWLPNGPELSSMATDLAVEAARERFAIHPQRFCLMYTGAHGLANALDTLVEAARYLDQAAPGQFQILLVGDGAEKSRLQQLGAGIANLEFRDALAKREIPDLLRAADALILTLKDVPLFQYGVSPNKLYDYYAAAKPVVVAVGGAVNGEVEHHQLGLAVPPEDPHRLAQAILALARLPAADRQAMGQRARQLAERTYSRQAVAEKFHHLIETHL